jgi:integrase
VQLVSLLDYFQTKWPGVTLALALTKVFLWSWGRRNEIAGLTWGDLRLVGDERHFEIVGKWGVEKWFRIPEVLYQDLLKLKSDSPFVFAAYCDQLHRFHENAPRPWLANRLKDEFCPENLGDWFYNRVSDWSKSLPKGVAYVHVFRKTSLQYARSGEDVNRRVAADARVGEGVLMTNYVKETDEEMRQRSNRTYARILASLSPEVACRYGYEPAPVDPLAQRLTEAIAAQNWALANAITAELAKRDRQAG